MDSDEDSDVLSDEEDDSSQDSSGDEDDGSVGSDDGSDDDDDSSDDDASTGGGSGGITAASTAGDDAGAGGGGAAAAPIDGAPGGGSVGERVAESLAKIQRIGSGMRHIQRRMLAGFAAAMARSPPPVLASDTPAGHVADEEEWDKFSADSVGGEVGADRPASPPGRRSPHRTRNAPSAGAGAGAGAGGGIGGQGNPGHHGPPAGARWGGPGSIMTELAFTSPQMYGNTEPYLVNALRGDPVSPRTHDALVNQAISDLLRPRAVGEPGGGGGRGAHFSRPWQQGYA